MTELNHDELRARFEAMREHDLRGAPPFEPIRNWAALRSGRMPRNRRQVVQWLAWAASILIIALLVAQPWNRAAPRRGAEPTTITAWQSPTASLLRSAAHSLLPPPPLLSSVFDGIRSTPLTKTD
ncbi:MAG: hypothetical protein ACJ8AK_07160 [Gemmatimonadaceae bacterium]